MSVRRGSLAFPALLGTLLAAVSCAGTGSEKAPAVAVPWRRAAAPSDGARWVFAPTKAATMNGKLALPDGATLFYGVGGQRWRVSADGVAEAAGELAEEDLVDVTRGADGAWIFVGALGRILEAREPLGPFARSSAPPEPVRRSSASGDRVLSVTTAGGLLRSTDGGRTFTRLGDNTTRFADALFVGGGKGDEVLALTLPERLWRSPDGGNTFAPLDRPPVGGTGLVKTPDGAAITGYYGAQNIIGSAPIGENEALSVTPPTGRMPAAGQLGSSLAFGDGKLVAVERSEGIIKIARGNVGERLAFEPLTGADDCNTFRVAARGSQIYGVCFPRVKGPRGASVQLRRWGAPNEKPEIVTGLVPTQGDVKLVPGPQDTLLVSGLCRAGSACTDAPLFLSAFRDLAPEPGLEPEPNEEETARPRKNRLAPMPTVSASKGPPPSAFVASSAPQMQGRPLAIAYAQSGTAFMLGLRAKTAQLTLFVSTDAGRTFSPRTLPAEISGLVRPGTNGRMRAQLSTDEPGVVSIVIETPFTAGVVTCDEDGRILAFGQPPGPNGSTSIGVSGRHMLAADRGAAHESLDGGASWRTLDPVGTLACVDSRCERPIACTIDGCLVGSDVARVGWGGKSNRVRSLGAPRDDLPPPLLRLPTPITCRLGKDKWLPFPVGEAGFPQASNADRGKVAWSVPHTSPTGGVSMIHGVPGITPRLETITLLRPPPKGSHTAFAVSSQLEGGAALRYTFDREKDGSVTLTKSPRDVEIAWENNFDGKVSHAKIAKTTTAMGMDDVEINDPLPSRARLGSLSISQGAIFVQLFSGRGPLQVIDYAGHVETLDAREAPNLSLAGEAIPFRPEYVRVGGKPIQLGFSAFGVVRLDTVPQAFALGMPGDQARADSATLVYKNGEPSLYHVYRPGSDGSDVGTVHAFHGTGPVVDAGTPALTQRDVAFTMRPCTDAERTSTHRIVARGSRPTVRGIVVEAPDGGFFAGAVSEEMVLYGTPSAPCVTALDGSTVAEEDSGVPSDRLLVMMNDLDHGWFFRRSERAPVEARSMKCRLNPKESLPKPVEDALARARAVAP